MAPWAVKNQIGPVANQPGSRLKKWNKRELIRCGAIGTTKHRDLNLQGVIHPIFAKWVKTDPELRKELQQPLLLASRILEAAGLPWLSDFLVNDIFAESYPGTTTEGCTESVVPQTITRHHRASWANEKVKTQWLNITRSQTEKEIAKSITWELDEHMFPERGWVGYTCRHPRGDLALAELDKYETIKKFDRCCKNKSYRNMSILIMAEYPRRLAELRKQGKAHGEEYLFTAFMTTVTILHELGHVVYWKDCRSLTRIAREPYYGADLEMELGDSFVAHIFGGWVPVPIRNFARLREDFSFEDGLSWRQFLSWDYHRLRPKHRAHYSISVEYIAQLFTEKSWSNPGTLEDLIRPQALTRGGTALRTVGMHEHLTHTNQHATAAVADFHGTGEGYMWNRRPGALFRIPQYDGWVCPEIDLPVATDDVIQEPTPRNPSSSHGPPRNEQQSSRKLALATKKNSMRTITPGTPEKRDSTADKTALATGGGLQVEELPLPTMQLSPGGAGVLSPTRSEISLDELKKRLSSLIGVSLTELERLFDAPQCS
ncbi:Uu.00g017100.m01.CDS01 [Anthostomella pinea]|uniref:Uu.00g017100.m01.CDS01 n=1 Tax=Anthostomella pinea TaxID=933095 RepID=A0AAI8VYW0_9PEZI|nr:Uu.00g017100.m01.CDS01 [Anthostomella pinea]